MASNDDASVVSYNHSAATIVFWVYMSIACLAFVVLLTLFYRRRHLSPISGRHRGLVIFQAVTSIFYGMMVAIEITIEDMSCELWFAYVNVFLFSLLIAFIVRLMALKVRYEVTHARLTLIRARGERQRLGLSTRGAGASESDDSSRGSNADGGGRGTAGSDAMPRADRMASVTATVGGVSSYAAEHDAEEEALDAARTFGTPNRHHSSGGSRRRLVNADRVGAAASSRSGRTNTHSSNNTNRDHQPNDDEATVELELSQSTHVLSTGGGGMPVVKRLSSADVDETDENYDDDFESTVDGPLSPQHPVHVRDDVCVDDESASRWWLSQRVLLRQRNLWLVIGFSVLLSVLAAVVFLAATNVPQVNTLPGERQRCLWVAGGLYVSSIVFLFCFVYLYFSFTLREVVDGFFIKEEFRIAGMIGLVVLPVWMSALLLMRDFNEHTFPISALVAMVAVTLPLYLVLGYPLYLSYRLEAQRRDLEDLPASAFDELLVVLQNNKARRVFRQHLLKEFSVENLAFWQACNALLARAPRALRQKRPSRVEAQCRMLYKEYVVHNSPYEVNLPARLRQEFHAVLGESPDLGAVNATPEERVQVLLDAVRHAQANIFDLMQRDSWPRFRVSSAFRELVEEHEKELAQRREADEVQTHFAEVNAFRETTI